MSASAAPRIILVRHGRPDHDGPGWCAPAEMGDWIECYNRAEVAAQECPASLPPLARAAGAVVCSSLSRCVQSKTRLIGDGPHQADPVYAEAHLPYPDWPLPKLPARLWRIGFRAAWFCGFARHTESIRVSNQRAKVAAERLIALAEENGSVLLMGHGIMNILIAWQLRSRGWSGPLHLLLKDFWQPSVYRKAGS
ncbi:MAG: fructose-2,6-bisphosphatase [Pseudomonas sp.]|uniref:fructose-2,6-bisphosphatase n=1 Tax=Pseudomonas sp. TaxID=306 RepID=UPI00339A525A